MSLTPTPTPNPKQAVVRGMRGQAGGGRAPADGKDGKDAPDAPDCSYAKTDDGLFLLVPRGLPSP